ncbi:hypothetical protein JM746_000090 [Shigella sonnei]|uniref:Uncharacterized protein n=3 Tax=Tequintavirus TaxID=187218 RepID=A0A482N2C9_9CAUD|nr:hypothetical protein HOV62_gp106 [Escherichia phage vB_Eco_mar004NP2]EHE3968331.1 hypothetical protein [Shigella sonnei]QBQ80641.1 hypothetical protein VAH1_00013 [Escherichia phage vB_EcoS_VAH1]QXV77339.1 hypothetical protein bas31_0157 [Escherichia phage DaisyDussoix]WNT48484.1 hypothetical protein SPLA5b_PHROGS00163 [Salmonella phage SPLA5b]QBQ80815.1 hypothetical protein VAH1_00208 [Escherichia phage vB_EcoS_VAH1]
MIDLVPITAGLIALLVLAVFIIVEQAKVIRRLKNNGKTSCLSGTKDCN